MLRNYESDKLDSIEMVVEKLGGRDTDSEMRTCRKVREGSWVLWILFLYKVLIFLGFGNLVWSFLIVLILVVL